MDKAVTQSYFDKIAAEYDNKKIPEPLRCYPLLLERLPKEFDSLLDVGCATGTMLQMIHENNKGRNLTLMGVDLSSEMIAEAKKKSIDIAFEIADVEKLPIKDNSFDIVTCMHSFHHYPNPDKALAEMYRVLKPGGRLFIVDNYRKGIARILENIVISLYIRRRKGDIKVYSLKEIGSLMNSVDFENIEQSLITEHSFVSVGRKINF